MQTEANDRDDDAAMSVRQGHGALVVVDMQNDNVRKDAPMYTPQATAAIAPIRRALGAARAGGVKVIFAAHAHRRDGSDMGHFAERYPAIREGRALIEGTPGAMICDELAPRADEPVIVKRRHSAFVGTDLDILLRCLSVETLVIAGFATSSCVLSTARDAIAANYRTVVLGDASAAGGVPDRGWGAWSGEQVHGVGLSVMAGNTARIWSVDQFVRSLAAEDGTRGRATAGTRTA